MPDSLPGPLATDTRTALSGLVRRACESSLRSPGAASRTEALRQAAQKLNSVVQDSLFQLSRGLNDSASVNQLPRELFLQILLDLSLPGRIRSSHVCRHWRSVALGCPDLWSDFKGGSRRRQSRGAPGGLDAASALLARSGSAPLSLNLFVSDSCDELGALLCQHMHHIRTLSLYVDFEFTRGDKALLILPLLRALEEPAPMLQHLNLRLSRLPRITAWDICVPDTLFAYAAPRLETVSLSAVALRTAHPIPALSSIRVLSVAQLEIDFLRVIELHPRLEQLHVGTIGLVSSDPPHRATAHNLQLLDIMGTVDAATMIATQLTCLKPLKVWMDLCKEDLLRYILSSAPKRSLRRVRLYINFPILSRYLELQYDCGLGITWALGPSVDTSVRQLVLQDAELMSGITHLALHELQWPLRASQMTLPRLRKLDLVLDSFADPGGGHMAEYSTRECAGLLYEDTPSILHCPLLEELHISFPMGLLATLSMGRPTFAVPTLAVDVHDISAFIARRLLYDGHRRPRLMLRNVHLYDPTRGAGMQVLTEVVDSIEYSVVTKPTEPQLHRAGHMMSWAYRMQE